MSYKPKVCDDCKQYLNINVSGYRSNSNTYLTNLLNWKYKNWNNW